VSLRELCKLALACCRLSVHKHHQNKTATQNSRQGRVFKMILIYFRLEKSTCVTQRWASADRNIVVHGGYPVAFQVYNHCRSKDYILSDMMTFFAERHGHNIQLIEVKTTEKNA
jgi:hypothetical protein